jgi:hypothetical protein
MRAKTLFLLKFLVLITVLLPLWLIGALPLYLPVLAEETAAVLRVAGYTILSTAGGRTQIELEYATGAWVKFEAALVTLNVVVYVALVLASVDVRWRRRLGFLLGGLLVLNLFQVLYVVVVFYVNFNYPPNSAAAQTIARVSEMFYLLLPMVLWAAFEAPRLFAGRRGERGRDRAAAGELRQQGASGP